MFFERSEKNGRGRGEGCQTEPRYVYNLCTTLVQHFFFKLTIGSVFLHVSHTYSIVNFEKKIV
jgi:hypothetical protein